MIFLEPQTITVEPWFVEWADDQKYVSERVKADAMLFERWLIRHKYVSPPNHKGHDFLWSNMKVDVKEIIGKWFNIQKYKTDWYTDSYNQGHLTHFLFIKTDRNPWSVLKIGDVVNVEPICVLPVKPVIKSINRSSINEGGFIDLATLYLLNEETQNG